VCAAERLKREARIMDLYQGLVLAFLALAVLVLAGIFTRLGPIRRSLETSGVEPATGPSPEEVGVAASVAEPRTEPEPGVAAGVPEPIAAGEPESVSADQPDPVAAEQPEPDVAEEVEPEGEPEREAEPVAEEPEREAEREAEPVVAEEAEVEPVAAEEPEAEEKPFQRDGRWWFRRDDELLVYDEASGEWLPGDAAASSFLIANEHTHDTALATGPDLSRGTASVATKEREPATEEEGEGFVGGEATEQLAAPSFWKCSTCGAVNGSTASTCRMCFAARP
jgi:hypothetical protein